MKAIQFKDFSLNLNKYLDSVAQSKEERVIKQANKKDLVLTPLQEYTSLKETLYLLSGKNGGVLRKSLKEANQ